MAVKSVILDLNVLDEQRLTIEEFLRLYGIYIDRHIKVKDDYISYAKLEKLLFIKRVNGTIHLREKAKELIEFLTVETDNSFTEQQKIITKSKRTISNEIENRVDEFRDKWKGLKAGSMGSRKACEQKLQRWMKENPQYSFDDILKAADRYINSLTNYNYLQQADYFIFKQDIHKGEMSRLSAFIDEIDTVDDDWTSQLK